MTEAVNGLFNWLGQLINPIASLPKGQRFLAMLALLQVAVVPFVIEHLPEEKRIFTIYSVTGLFVLLLVIIFFSDTRTRKLIRKSRRLIKENRFLRSEKTNIEARVEEIHVAREREKAQFEKVISAKETAAEDHFFNRIILLLDIKRKLSQVSQLAEQKLQAEAISISDMEEIQQSIGNLAEEVETQLKDFSERQRRIAEARKLEQEIGMP
jgi:Sec-independent protein translocase protein TatA